MKDLFTGKTIILGVPNHFGLPERFKENLEYLGFKVYLLEFTGKFSLDFKDKLIHVSKKIFLKDKTYKAKKKADFFEKKQIDFFESLPENIDYALIIRPDLFGKNVIEKINKKVSLSVAYQWDGLDRFPLVKEYIEDFDRFFVFDIRDLEKFPKCLPTTNFYFDDLMKPTSINKDVFFVGTFMKNRISKIIELSNLFKELGLRKKIILQVTKNFNKRKFSKEINYSKKSLSFRENIESMKQARIVLDFKNDIHYGLSFRTFEAIGFNKKLITNNNLVESYDFYNPKNIFVLKENYKEELKKFLIEPYEKLNDDIVEKYGFTNWIKYVLDIKPHKKITLQYAKDY